MDDRLSNAAFAAEAGGLTSGRYNKAVAGLHTGLPFPSSLYSALTSGEKRPSAVLRELIRDLTDLAVTWEEHEGINVDPRDEADTDWQAAATQWMRRATYFQMRLLAHGEIANCEDADARLDEVHRRTVMSVMRAQRDAAFAELVDRCTATGSNIELTRNPYYVALAAETAAADDALDGEIGTYEVGEDADRPGDDP